MSAQSETLTRGPGTGTSNNQPVRALDEDSRIIRFSRSGRGESANTAVLKSDAPEDLVEVYAGKIIRSSIETPRRRPGRTFIRSAEWEGVVTDRLSSSFVAEVIDRETDERATAEFDLSEVSVADIPLCEPGALFYWSIGYSVEAGGQRSRSSVLMFRRLGKHANTAQQ